MLSALAGEVMGTRMGILDLIRKHVATARAALTGSAHSKGHQERGTSLPNRAVADPLGHVWTELDWLMAEGADVIRTLDDLGEAAEDERPAIPLLFNVEAFLREVEAQPRLPSANFHGRPRYDALRIYLENLRDHEDAAMPLLK